MTKAETVYSIYSKKIDTGELKPGQVVNENRIAKEMDINRSAVREALNRLIIDGRVEKHQNRRKYVSVVHKHEVDELIQFRAALESAAAALTAINVSRETLKELKKLIQDHKYFVEREYWDLTDNVERRFHLLLVEQSKNRYIIDEYKHSKIAIHIKIEEYEKEKKHESQIISEHEAIVQALEDRDSEQAMLAAWNHLIR